MAIRKTIYTKLSQSELAHRRNGGFDVLACRGLVRQTEPCGGDDRVASCGRMRGGNVLLPHSITGNGIHERVADLHVDHQGHPHKGLCQCADIGVEPVPTGPAVYDLRKQSRLQDRLL